MITALLTIGAGAITANAAGANATAPVTAASPTPGPNQQGLSPPSSAIDHPRGIVPHANKGQKSKPTPAPVGLSANPNCGACAPPLVFHRGNPVMGGGLTGSGAPGHVTITPFYWAPSGYSFAATYKSVINGYIQNVATASQQNTNVFSVGTQYYQQGSNAGAPIQHIQYVVQAGAEVDDSTTYPHSCSIASGYTACISDGALQTELLARLTALSLPIDNAHLYLAMFPAAVETCLSSATCSSNTYCAYHSSKAVGSGYMIYGNEPYPILIQCSLSPEAPNGDAYADAQVSLISHEANESITDWASAWYDAAGYENGDECAYVYGVPLGSTGGSNTHYNQVIGSGKYYTQDEFSNEDYALSGGDTQTATGPVVAGCVQRDELPTASVTGPSSVAAGTSSTFNGSGSDPDTTTAVTYSWAWGDNTANGSGASATHTFSSPGTYTVTVTVTDVDGWSATVSRVVTVTGITRGIMRFMSTDFASMHSAGFNAASDGQVYGSAEAVAGIAGMVWVDAYNNTTCSQTMTDAAITSAVQANVNARLRGLRYEIGDEPTTHGCAAAATYTHITQLVHAADSTAKTWVIDGQFQVGDPVQQGVPMKGSVDILAFDVYPCQSGACDYSAIDSAVQQIHAANVTNWEFIIQDFNMSPWRWPTPAEIQAQFDHWRGQGASAYWVFAWDYLGQPVTGQAGNVAALQQINSQDPSVPSYSQSPQGNWVGTYGADGYALLGWNGSSDLVSLPQSSLVLDQGARCQWSAATTAVQALQSPDASTRRAACFFDFSQIRLHLVFPAAYSGTLHLYALDWDSTSRRETITINDGSAPQTANISTAFNQGAWVNAPINVPAGGSLTISVTRTAGANAVLSGIFFGGPIPVPAAPTTLSASAASSSQISLSWTGSSGASSYKIQRSADGSTGWAQVGSSNTTSFTDSGLTPSTTYFYRVLASNGSGDSGPSNVASASTGAGLAYTQSPQGNWVGTYGADGYALLGWNGSSDLVSLPQSTLVLDQGARYQWSAATTAVQALQSPDASTRRAACFYDGSQIRLHLVFPAATAAPSISMPSTGTAPLGARP